MTSGAPILSLNGVDTFYGDSHILHDVSFELRRGEVIALLGRNGVGKTTTLRTIMGLMAPYRGSVRYNGADITGRPAFQVAKLGMGFVPEDRRIFPDLTVRQNLEVARKEPATAHARTWTVEAVFETFPALAELAGRKGGYLSGGEQQMLTIGRTLMGNPDLLLLDEPSEGLAPLIVRDLGRQIGRLKEQGLTILLCEQNAKFAARLSDRAYILEKGHVRFSGSIEELHRNDEVRRQHLGL
jgi:branched-chain amino acid transport system ATP-binding protein